MSKYDPITRWLNGHTQASVLATFSHLEKILGFSLPGSARQHQAWWANESITRQVQCKSWLNAGRKASADLVRETVVFSK